MSGAVVKGPVAGAQVCAYTVVGNARGTALGSCTTTDGSGNYSFAVPAGTGPLWVEASGGSYTDEVTGAAATLNVGSPLRSIITANAGTGTVTTMLTPLTTLALNAAAATVGSGGTLNAAAFATAATQLLSAFNLPSTLNITATAPTFGSGINSYGTALTAISRMVANGTTLVAILANSNPQVLASAFATAATPPVTSPPGGGATASGSITSTGGVETFVPRSAPGGTTPVFSAELASGIAVYNFYNFIRVTDSSGNSNGVAGQSFNLTLVGGRPVGLIFIETSSVAGTGRAVMRYCPQPCSGLTIETTANGKGLTLTLRDARFETDLNGTTASNPPTAPIVMNGSLTGNAPAN